MEQSADNKPEGARGRRSGRGGGRAGKAAEARPAIEQLPFEQPYNPYQPLDIVSEDELEAIHLESLKVLREIGMMVTNVEARRIFREAGADVDEATEMVRLPDGFVDKHLKTVPSAFELHGRNPARRIKIGGKWIAYTPVASPPNSGDNDDLRRTGNSEDFQNFLRLSQYFNCFHATGGYSVEPIDWPVSIRHLKAGQAKAKLTDKSLNIYALGTPQIEDSLEIIRLANGWTEEQLCSTPTASTVVNTNSPLKLDTPMAQGIIEMSKRNQAVIVTPFTLAGAMAPVSIAGAITQQNAEALLGIVLTQLVRPGAPVVYGCFTSNVDMKSGAPAFGTPEHMQGILLGGQLCRKYGIPMRASNVTAANTNDAQSQIENVLALWAVTMSQANYVLHSAGWLEGGLRASFEKFVIDADVLQMVQKFLKPPKVDQAEMAFDAMKDVGPGGHFFGTAHTQSRYSNAFFSPMISDWRNFETWDEAGRPTADQKANQLYKAALADYKQPELAPERAEAIDAFVAKRIADGGVKGDF